MIKNLEDMVAVPIGSGASGGVPPTGQGAWLYPSNVAALKPGLNSTSALILHVKLPSCEWKVTEYPIPSLGLTPLFKLFIEGINMNNYGMLIVGMIELAKNLDVPVVKTGFEEILDVYTLQSDMLPAKGYSLLFEKIFMTYAEFGVTFPEPAARDILLPLTPLLRLMLPEPALIALGYELVLVPPSSKYPELCGLVTPKPPTNYATRVRNSLLVHDAWTAHYPNLRKSPRFLRKIASMNRYLGERYVPNPAVLSNLTGFEIMEMFTDPVSEGIFNPKTAIAQALLIGHLKEEVTREEWLIRYKINAISFISVAKDSIKEVIAKIRFEIAEYNQAYRQLTMARADQAVNLRIYSKIDAVKFKALDEDIIDRAEKFRFDAAKKIQKNKILSRARDMIDIKERYKEQMEVAKIRLLELSNIAKRIVIGFTGMEVSPEEYGDLIVAHETLGLAADIVGEEDVNISEYIGAVENLPEDLKEPIRHESEDDATVVIPADMAEQPVLPSEMLTEEQFPVRNIAESIIEAGEAANIIEPENEEIKVSTPPMFNDDDEEEEPPLAIGYIPFMEPLESELTSERRIQEIEAARIAREAKEKEDKLERDRREEEKKKEILLEKKRAWELREKERLKKLYEAAARSKARASPEKEADRGRPLEEIKRGKSPRREIEKSITLEKVNKTIEKIDEGKMLDLAAEASISFVQNDRLNQAIKRRVGRIIDNAAAALEKRTESTKRDRKLSRKRNFSVMRHDIKNARTVINALVSKEKSGKVINATERDWLYYNNYMSIMNNRELRLKKKDVLIAMVKDRIGKMIVEASEKDNYFNSVPKPRDWADIRAVMKGSTMYELIEFPRVEAQMLIRKEASPIVDLWADIILAEMMPLSGEHTIEFVYYVTDDLKKKIGNGGNFRVTINADYTKKDIVLAIDQAVLSFNDRISETNEVQGSGNVRISLLLNEGQRRRNNPNATARVYIQYMRLVRDPKEMDMNVEIKAYANFLLEPHYKVRRLIEFDTKTDIGVCIFEAYYIIRGGGYNSLRKLANPVPLSTTPAWSEFIAGELINNYPEYIQLCQDGEAKMFLEQIYDIEHMNIGLYNAYNGELWAPNMNIPCLERVMLYYANHVYVSNITKLLKANGKSKEYDGTNMFHLFRKNAEIKYARTFKPYSLNDMKDDKEKKKDIPAKANNPRAPNTDTIRHVHWGFDYETYAVDASGLQAPYLLVVGKINDDKNEYDPKNPIKPRVYRGLNCTVDFIFDVIIPILSQKDSKVIHHFWAYNGANFDFHFLIVALQHVFQIKILGSSTSIKTMKIGNNIDFLDLGCWYSVPYDKTTEMSGLRALAASCKTYNQKSNFEHKITETDLKNDDLMAAAIKYCCQDVFTLNELVYLLAIRTYESFEYKGRKACRPTARMYPYSAAMLAVTIYKNCFMGPLLDIKASPMAIYRIERESYHGGITLAFQPMATNVKCYDINSSYPAVMMNSKMPYKYERTINYSTPEVYSMERSKFLTFNDYDLFQIYGFVFPADCFLPCLMIKSPNGSMIQVKKWNENDGGVVTCWGYELRYAMEQGALIFVKARHVFEGRILFDEYVKYFYSEKTKAKETKNVVMELFNKNLLNSLQGKLGEKEHSSKSLGQLHIISNEIYAKGEEAVKGVEYIGKGLYRATWVVEDQEYLGKVGSLVRIPSFIAASGRINLIKAINSVPKKCVVYGDTDSITLADGCILPPSFVHQTELGKFKLELHKCAEVMFCFGAKNYVLFHGTKPAITCKGVRSIKDPTAFVRTMIVNKEHKAEITPYFKKKFGEVYVTKITRTLRNTFCLKRIYNEEGSSESFLDINEYMAASSKFKAEATRINAVPDTALIKSRSEERKAMINQLNVAALEQPQDIQAALHYSLLESHCGKVKLELADRFTKALNLAIRGETLERELELREFYRDLKTADALSGLNKITQIKNDIMNLSKKMDTIIEELIKDKRDPHQALPQDETIILEEKNEGRVATEIIEDISEEEMSGEDN